MKNKLLLILLLICTTSIFAQDNEKFNLGFEAKDSDEKLSTGWFKWGDYDLSVDNDQKKSGEYAGKITANEKSEFGSMAYKIPAKYSGQKIKLEGFMKLENVTNGFSGLLLRVDGNGRSLAFDNMESQNINGTKDWQKYSVELDYPSEAKTIYVAGILVGEGTAWFDDFTLTIDGKDVQTMPEIVVKAELDKEFDGGSNINFPDLSDKNVITNLELLGKVWGFMKYNHHAPNSTDYNWDYELFRMLPDYLTAKNNKQRDKYLIQWIESYGRIPTCYTCEETPNDAFLKPNLAWMDDKNLSKKLRKTLQYMYTNRVQGKHFYISSALNIGNPQFINERTYGEMTYPDAGFRLLSLYRYWNMIEYFFPYKHQTDKKWDRVLTEYIPHFLNAKDELAYETAALHIIGEIHDTHANLWGGGDKLKEKKGSNYPPFEVRFVEDQLVVFKFYNQEIGQKLAIEQGDVITHINGTSVSDLVKQMAIDYPASNEPTRLRNISYDILRSPNKEISIKYLSNNKAQTTNLSLYTRDDLKEWNKKDDEKCYKMLDNNIGYITLATIQYDDIEQIKKQFKDTKGIVIDIRNYPSTFVPFSLGGFFVSEPTSFVKFTNLNIDNPGEFSFTQSLTIPNQESTYKGKLVVLVNEESQSQAEYTTMAFRAGDNTTVIGSTTAGADGNVSRIMLPGGLRTMISGIGVFYPNGEPTQRIGIVPDIEVKPTIKGVKNGQDELLEKAIEVILE